MASNHPYAAALLDLTEEQNATDTVVAQAEELAALIDADADLRNALENPALGTDARRGFLQRVFEGRLHDTLYRLIQVMNQNGRASYIGVMARAYIKRVDEHRGVVDVEATVAQELDDASAAALRDQLGAVLGGKTVHLDTRVDPSLIGGVRLRIGDQLIDGSVQTRLRRMREKLKAAGREKARQTAATGAPAVA